MFYKSKFSFTSTSDTLELQFLELCNKEYSNDETEIGLVTTSYYRFEKEYDGIRIIKEQLSSRGIQPVPDAILKFNSTQQIDLEVKLSDVWKFFIIIFYLIIVAVFVVLFITSKNLFMLSLGFIGVIAIIQFMIYSFHHSQVFLFKNMIEKLVMKFDAIQALDRKL